MLSSVRPPTDLVAMKLTMVWDGMFHAFTWSMVVLGLWRPWRAGCRADVQWSDGISRSASPRSPVR